MDQSHGETKHFVEYTTDPNNDIVEYKLEKSTGHFVKEVFEVEDVYEEYPAVSSDNLNLSCTQSQSRWENWEGKQDGKRFSRQMFLMVIVLTTWNLRYHSIFDSTGQPGRYTKKNYPDWLISKDADNSHREYAGA